MTTNDRNQYLMSGVALAISAIAMVFTFLQLRAADRQLQADVWPYVDISITLQADVFDLQLSNKGLGPALIHEFRLVQDGVEVTHPLGLVHLAGRSNAGLAMQVGSVPDSVLAVGEDLTAFRITGEGLGLTMRDTIAGLDIEICYCSINGACWNNYANNGFRDRTPSCRTQSIDLDEALRMITPQTSEPASSGTENSVPEHGEPEHGETGE